MSVEQSSQLILLIMNSVLMMLLSAALLGGVWLRQNTLSQQIQQIKINQQQITQDSQGQQNNRARPQHVQADLRKLRSDRTRLMHQYIWSRLSLLLLNVVLLIFSVSLCLLALRSLLAFDSLISSSLFFFTLGSVGLFVGAGCVFIDIAQESSEMDSFHSAVGRAISQVVRRVPKQKRYR